MRIFLVLAFAIPLGGCAPKSASPPSSPRSAVPLSAAPSELTGKLFVPDCPVPFGSIGAVRSIDDSCDAEGNGDSKSKLQNSAKNNLCAAPPAIDITEARLQKLQEAVDELVTAGGFTYGSANALPADRTILHSLPGQSLGEGMLVRGVLYYIHATYSNVSKGEQVNCKTSGREANDIHIYLSFRRDVDDRCESVTAEISPHFRPEAWEKIVELIIHPHRPLRVTGQLFFDASHKPCSDGHRANPARFTSWEIHPVYNLEVCRNRSVSGCKGSDDAVWMPFDEWLGEDEHEDDTDE